MTLDITVDARDWTIMPVSEVDEVIQNVAMIIATAKGTVPYDRTFGVDPAKVDAPINVAQAKLTAEIAAAIRTQEPRARLARVFYYGDAADGQLGIRARIELVEKNMRGYI